MRTAICKKLNRTLAMVLSIVLVFSVLPSSRMAYAATEGHPDTVTITVVNEQGQPIKGATVSINVDSVSNGNASASNNDPYISGTKITDENGVVEIMTSGDFIPNDMTLSTTVTADGYFKEIMETAISGADQNFVITLKSTKISDVTIEGKGELVYTVDENGVPVAQEAVTVNEKPGDTVTYEIDGTPADGKAMVTDVKVVDGEIKPYIITVTVTRTGYEPLVETVYTTVKPADQTFSFTNNYVNGGETKVTVSGGDAYVCDFSAIDEDKLANGEITYAMQLTSGNASNVSIDAESGQLTVNGPAVVTVSATLSSNNKNYKACTISHTLAVYNVGEFISFEEAEVDYVLGKSDTIAEQQATIKGGATGNITYSMESIPGIFIDNESGALTVEDYDELAEEISSNNGCLKVIVTATKEANGNYGKDIAWYKVNISFERTPDNPYVLPDVEKYGKNGWYNTEVEVSPATGYMIAQAASGDFDTSTPFSNQGNEDRYVYLKNIKTGAITDKIAIKDAAGQNIKIDTEKPYDLKISFSESEASMISRIAEKLGFYQSKVTITFEAKDTTSGVSHFDWTYTKEEGASSINVDSKTGTLEATYVNGVATAELILPSNEAEQLRGKISFNATDKAGNVSDDRTEDYVIVVDNNKPTREVAYTSPVRTLNGDHHYYSDDVEFIFTIEEANFYKEDVVLKVSKDGEEAEKVDEKEITWDTDTVSSGDVHVGRYTLSGDGDYIVSMTYSDRAQNIMDFYKSDLLTIDTTSPEVNMKYVHEGKVQKTIFTVKERNFRASDIVVTGTMKDINGNDVDYTTKKLTAHLQKAKWVENSDDTYTYEYDGYVDGIYNLKMDYKDIVNWEAETFNAEEFIIDYSGPDNVSIAIKTSPVESLKKILSFGFYKTKAKVEFTAYDDVTGVKEFNWNYTKQNGASDINRSTDSVSTTVTAKQDKKDKSKYTATVTLPNTSAKQLRGYLAVVAIDNYDNESDKVTDSKNIIVVDTIAPNVTVEYSKASRTVDDKAYYNGNVDVTISVDEANFYADDVVVKVSQDGGAAKKVTPTWEKAAKKSDIHYGTFTLKKNGHYIITVEYKDKSGNYNAKKSAYKSHEITIDTLNPLVEVTYSNGAMGNSEGGRKYFATTQTAVVKITEHNFEPEDVVLRISAKDVTGQNLNASTLYTKTKWTTDKTGDVHTMTITYPGDANYVFDIDCTDLANNAATDYTPDYFTVDKAKPTNMTVAYSTGVLETVLENITFGFYNAKMTVTLTAEDVTSGVRDFNYSYVKAAGVSGVNAELINQKASEANIQYSDEGRKATVSFEIPKDALGSDSQFNGTVAFSAEDNAGNATGTYQETRRIVVDNIAPTVQVNYNEPVNTVDDISYYDGNINATVVITEANFYPEDVRIMVSKDGGTEAEVIASWTDRSTDIHEGTFTLTEQGEYFITVNYRDKSSNEMMAYTSNQLVIDTAIDEVPAFKINGTEKGEEGGAYKGDVKVEFNYGDVNFDGKTITFTRTRFDKTEDVTDLIQFDNPEKGGSFTIPANVIENDGIYDLTINITDKAGHSEESHIRFTVNRYGSVYEYGSYLASLIKDGPQYLKIEKGNDAAITGDLVIKEYNAGRINDNSLKILITRDGEPLDNVDYTTNPKDINSQVEVSEKGWYEYVYTIKASNFAEDGVYKITLVSEYATDDVTGNNESASVPENSIDEEGNQILDTMSFVVDTEKPEIRNIVNLDETSVNATQIDVQYTIVDVGGLKSVEIILNGETVDTVTEFGDDIFNYSGTFLIKEKDKSQTVQIKATDIAGNVTDTAADDFDTKGVYVFNDSIVVTTNAWVRWYENKPFFWGTIGGVFVLVGGACSVFAFRRRKKLNV